MLTPRYFFTDDFSQFHEYFFQQPHTKKSIQKGDFLWAPSEPFQRIHYILDGIAQNYVEHENGHRRILSFHGKGTVFPGYHQQDFKIERSLITKAITHMEVLEFTKADFKRMFEENPALSANVVEWFSTYVNLLLYDTAHQEYNTTFEKLCNLLYLLLKTPEFGRANAIGITQDDIADMLGTSRVNLTRALSELRDRNILLTRRGRIEITDLPALAQLCSLETR